MLFRSLGRDPLWIVSCAAPAIPVAQAIGRWGNWFNQELFGRPTSLPWALEVSAEKARAAGNYEKVLAHTGRMVSHYGLTNHKEYFAEGTEAFFYRNDFYPFVRAELKEHDPALHDLLIKIWEQVQ